MKKITLAATIVMACCGTVDAQTSVTLYGAIEGGLGYTRFKDKNPGALGDTATLAGIDDGARNRWGLRGAENLGNGLKMLFQLESGFNLFTGTSAQPLGGTGRLFGREASLALTSDAWGTLKFGRHTNFASLWAANVVTPWGNIYKEARSGSTFTSTATVRVDNLISYETPVFSGFQFGIGYAFHVAGAQPWDVDGQTDGDENLITVGLRYNSGPLTLAASYDQLDGAAPGGPPYTRDPKDINAWVLGAAYDFGSVKLHLGLGQDRNGTLFSRSTHTNLPRTFTAAHSQTIFAYRNGYKTNNYSVGLAVPLPEGRLMVAWQSARLGSGAYKTAAEKNSYDRYSLVYTYPFSKRTSLYAAGTYGTGYAFANVTLTQGIVGLYHLF